jgi:hypothetical protein
MARPDTYAEFAEAVRDRPGRKPTYDEWLTMRAAQNNWSGHAEPDPPEPPAEPAEPAEEHTRRLALTRASNIAVRPVHWLWAARIALGSEAAGWLEDYLSSQGGTDDSATIKAKGAKAGHSVDALKRARKRLKAPITAHGYPRQTYWSLAGTQLEQLAGAVGADSRSKSGESAPTELTTPTEPVSAVGAVGGCPPARETAEDEPDLPIETHAQGTTSPLSHARRTSTN